MSSHGLPKLIGILTHLDLIKSQSALRQQKKRLKKRFWTEVYDGAKLFYLSGVINGRYPDREILNLSRFISVAKFRPLTFRNSHSYLLADRLEDLTSRETLRLNPKADRTVAMWGYLRGIPMRSPSANSGLKIHIPGSGADSFSVTRLAQLVDPCPLPTAESEKRRKLSDKNRLVHAPFSGGAAGLLGGSGAVSFEGDRVWVNTAGNFTRKNGEEADGDVGEGEKMVMDMQDVGYTLGDKIGTSQLRLFAGDAAPLALPEQGSSTGGRRRRLAFDEDELRDEDDGAEVSDVSDDEEGEDLDPDDNEEGPALLNDRDGDDAGDVVEYDDISDSDLDLDEDGDGVGFEQADAGGDILDYEADNLLGEEEEEDEEGPQWKRNLAEQARRNFAVGAANKRPNLMDMIYNSALTSIEVYRRQITSDHDAEVNGSAGDEDDLFQLARTSALALEDDEEDRFRPTMKPKTLDWEDEDVVESFRKFFVSGQNFDGEEDGAGGDKGFEDLEADGAEDVGDERDDQVDKTPVQTSEEELAAKKERLKRKFNAEYDGSSDEEGGKDFYSEQKEEIRKRLEATQAEFEGDDPETRALVEGYRPGAYVRLEFSNVPSELLDNFNPRFPLVVGALLPHEENFGFVQVRIKKHRWHPKILKTNDPLIFSIGWRRFQTVPIYSLDDGTRNRMLKYTPEHMHCLATFYGPISSPNTGFCAFNTIGNEKASFRISATGVVTDVDGSSRITKKLKLTGVPRRLIPNSARICANDLLI